MMKKQNFSTTIFIDTKTSTIQCTAMIGNDEKSIVHQVKNYSGAHFDDLFFKVFKDSVSEFVKERPSEAIGRTSLILPDNVVALDTVNVPTMRNSAATKKALDNALGEIYRNIDGLKIQSFVAAQNKQYTTFNTAAIQKKILENIYSICSENRLLVDTTTYAASSSVAALSVLVPKLKNASYLFLDIKRMFSRFVFVVNGRAVGFYHLPFGLDFLTRSRYVQEDMLFDHSMGELTVLNAKEKAKARKLSVLAEGGSTAFSEAYGGEENVNNGSSDNENSATISSEGNIEPDDNSTDVDDDDDVDLTEEETVTDSSDSEPFNVPTETHVTQTPKYMAKKTPRRLPKFMQRPIPETAEDIAKENFRVYVKWALLLIANNGKLTTLGAPSFVCVNIPDDFAYVLDAANNEKDEQGIEFRKIGTGDIDPNILSHLELYGGYFPKMIHPANKF